MTIIRYIRSDWSNKFIVQSRFSDGSNNSVSLPGEMVSSQYSKALANHDTVTKISFYYPFNFIGPLPPNG
mgnify:CR=1 FL=1